jgi:acetyltransferase-like isoleucine patch superfamily enzyme
MKITIGTKLLVDGEHEVVIVGSSTEVGALVTASTIPSWVNRIWQAKFCKVKNDNNIAVAEVAALLGRKQSEIQIMVDGLWQDISVVSYSQMLKTKGVYRCVSHPNEKDGRLVVINPNVIFYYNPKLNYTDIINRYWNDGNHFFELTDEVYTTA